jgi:hypothetical protein
MDFSKYANNLPASNLPFKDARRLYVAEEARLKELFKQDALREVGLLGGGGLYKHPKADYAFALAWQYKHELGYEEVLDCLRDLARLLVD